MLSPKSNKVFPDNKNSEISTNRLIDSSYKN